MTFSRGRFASSSEHSHMKDLKAEHFPTGQWSLHVFPCSSHQRGWVISLLSPGQNRNTNYCGLEINRKKYGGPIAGGQDGLPLLLLSLLFSSVAWDASASWSASSCVCSSAKGDICTPHQAWHQPTLGRCGLGGHVENNCLLERFVSCWSHIGFVLFTCLPLGFLFMFIIPLLSFPL